MLAEGQTPRMREALAADEEMIVWWGTFVECSAAIARRERTGELSAVSADQARLALRLFQTSWSEVEASDDLRDHATALVRRHSLRSADAFQLGAALAWAHGRPRDHVICTLDGRLTEAARREGFRIEPRSDAG